MIVLLNVLTSKPLKSRFAPGPCAPKLPPPGPYGLLFWSPTGSNMHFRLNASVNITTNVRQPPNTINIGSRSTCATCVLPCTCTKNRNFQLHLLYFFDFSCKTLLDGLQDASWARFFPKMTIFDAQLGARNRPKTPSVLKHPDIFALLGVWCRLLAQLGPIWEPFGPQLGPTWADFSTFLGCILATITPPIHPSFVHVLIRPLQAYD